MPEARRLPFRAALVLAVAALAVPLGALPEAAQAPLERARAAAGAGDGIAAEAALRQALDAGASRDEIAARMGEAYLLQGDPAKAGEWLLPGRFTKRDAALGWRMTGQMHRIQGKLGDAGKAYDQALSLNLRDPLLWVEIGRLRYAGAEHFGAIEAADRALALGPEEPRAIELRAQLLREAAGPVAASMLYERGLAAAPDDRALLAGYAAALGEAGRPADMLVVVRQLHKVDPRSPLPLYFQAVIAARAGKTDLARSLLTRLGNRLGEQPSAMLLQGALELEAGNTTMAVEVLERLDRRQPANPRVQALYAAALLANGDHTAVRQRFIPLAARADAPAYLLTLVGRSFEQTGDRAAAAQWLDRAAAATMPPVMAIADRDPLASSAARSDSFEGLILRGDSAYARQSLGEAFAAYDRAALIRYPDWLMLRAALTLEATGRGRMAVDAAWRYHAGFPDSLLAQRLAGGGAGAAGNWDQAQQVFEALDVRQGHRDVRLLADLSLAQLRSDQADAALRSAEAAHKLQRASGITAQARGMALARLKHDSDMTKQLLAKARKTLGDNPLLKQAQADLGKR